jgi:hypothetical protein
MTLRLRSILVCGGLLLLASSSFAQGEYQQAKDGKTLIWNGTPKPGETATWDGDRDKENYATGFGALTWYTANGKVYGLYYGNMAHGKLEGPVNVHTNGRTAHAYFADGGRVTGWARGPAPSKMAVPEEAIVEKRKVQAGKEAAAAKRTADVAEAERKRKPAPEKLRPAESVATKSETKPEKAEVSSSETPGSETPAAVVEKQSEPPTVASPARTFDEPTPIPAKPEIASRKSEPTQRPTAEPSVTTSVINEPPHEELTTPKTEIAGGASEITRESPPASTKKESPADVSLKALVGPPSSLRTTTETSTPKMETETSTSRDSVPLTEAQAIDLADTEARRQGAPLDDYQRPKVDHSAVKGRWSLFYDLKEGKSAAESGGPFTVTVEDKTKKVEIRK